MWCQARTPVPGPRHNTKWFRDVGVTKTVFRQASRQLLSCSLTSSPLFHHSQSKWKVRQVKEAEADNRQAFVCSRQSFLKVNVQTTSQRRPQFLVIKLPSPCRILLQLSAPSRPKRRSAPTTKTKARITPRIAPTTTLTCIKPSSTTI